MRHNYSFDDSEVMRELAKIADEKNLITKTASYDLVQALARGDYGAGAMNPGLGKEFAAAAQNNPKDPAGAVRALMEGKLSWLQPEQRQAVESILAAHAPEPQATPEAGPKGGWPARIADALKKAAPKGGTGRVQFDMLIRQLGQFRPETEPEVLKEHLKKWFNVPGVGPVLVKHLGAPGKKASKTESEKVKMAEERLYDVSGETGEQLVDKAHPGGGTRTELTHSKTDENLVETIVEQQKRDVEVALSMPKGTYAALLNLADHLDKLGYVKAADRVDALLKKKVKLAADQWDPANQLNIMYGQQFVDQMLSEYHPYTGTGQGLLETLKKWRGKEGLDTMIREVNRYGIGIQRDEDVQGVLSRFQPQLAQLQKYRQQMLAKQQQQQQQPEGVATTQETGKEPELVDKVPEKRKRLTRLQNQLRRMVGLQPKKESPFDRQLANVLRKNYPDAWTAVKNKAGFRAIFDAIKNQGTGTAKKEETAPPPPPEAPPQASGDVVNLQNETLELLTRKYPRANVRDRKQWLGLHKRIFEMLRDNKGTPETIADYFNIDRMKAIRDNKLAPPAMPKPRMSLSPRR